MQRPNATAGAARPNRRPKIRHRLLTGALALVMAMGAVGAAAPAAQANSSFPQYQAVDAVGGVYWRTSPDWNQSLRRPGLGFYPGDTLQLFCYQWGTTTPYSSNRLWYYASDLSRDPGYAGWVNDHFLNTPGTAANPQPVTMPCN